jgi:hypothetical protein
MRERSAHPYRDTDVIDSRAPRVNQAVIGSLALVAVLTGTEWILPVLAAQLAVGLTFGRQYCLPCLFYFEVLQPRVGEGALEDSRPPRFANLVGVVFLTVASVAIYAGAETLGWALASVVAALALLAATTGLCLGCEMYLLWVRVRRLTPTRLDPRELALRGDGVTILEFASRYCLACQQWERVLEEQRLPWAKIDVGDRPDLVRRYRIAHTPQLLAVTPNGEVLDRVEGDPRAESVRRLRKLANAEA